MHSSVPLPYEIFIQEDKYCIKVYTHRETIKIQELFPGNLLNLKGFAQL